MNPLPSEACPCGVCRDPIVAKGHSVAGRLATSLAVVTVMALGMGRGLAEEEGEDSDDGSASDPGRLNVKSVAAELASHEQVKPAVFPIDLAHSKLGYFYDIGDDFNEVLALTCGIDYTTLLQRASFTESGDDTGFSQVFRILGTWLHIGSDEGNKGNLVWKMETRNALGGYPAPRDLSFDTGTSLGTANFKELNYWGITDLHWVQKFQDGKYKIRVGHMDPGDWADQYPLLNAWTSFMNDAFYNNPTEAIPSRGFGVVGQIFTEENFYLGAGIHDANGGDGRLDPGSFFDGGEYFSWVEFGVRDSLNPNTPQNAHIHLWHQDERVEAGTEESKGIAYTHSFFLRDEDVAFVRAGYSEGDAAPMRRFVGAGYSCKPFGRDTLGIASSWGSPPEKALRDQITSEVFYRIQLTRNLSISPDLQAIYQPSYAPGKNWVFLTGLRMRMVF